MFGFVVSLVAGFIYKVDVIARDSGGWLVDLMYVVLSCVDSVAANMRYRASKHFNYIAAIWWIDRSTRNNIFSLSLSVSVDRHKCFHITHKCLTHSRSANTTVLSWLGYR